MDLKKTKELFLIPMTTTVTLIKLVILSCFSHTGFVLKVENAFKATSCPGG